MEGSSLPYLAWRAVQQLLYLRPLRWTPHPALYDMAFQCIFVLCTEQLFIKVNDTFILCDQFCTNITGTKTSSELINIALWSQKCLTFVCI